MAESNRRRVPALAVLAVLGVVAVMAGCDWLQGTDMNVRLSPFLTSLSISKGNVGCNEEFTFSFQYDDPQGDIANATATLQREGDTSVREVAFPWPDNISRSSGTAQFALNFPCGTSTAGRYSLAVRVDDGRHTSNILSGSITLNP